MFRRAALAIIGRPGLRVPTALVAPSIGPINPKFASLYTHQLSPNHQLPHVRYFSNEMTADWPEGIKKFLEFEKIDKPTLIQEKTLPVVMENKDLVGIARTGSGKTLAFVIPAIMKILKAREERPSGDRFELRPPTCLVLAPTRELANQTGSVISKFKDLGVSSVCLVGGSSRSDQLRELSRNNQDFYVATPGRLMDLIDSELVDLSQIKYLVLDEADRMLDMGFEPQIRRIISHIPKERQTVMWSATWPREIQSLASEFMKSYEYVAVDSKSLKANPNIKQMVAMCQPTNKIKVLISYLEQFKQECGEPRTLIFVNTKRMAEMLLIHLMRNRIRAISIHGDRSQRQRDDALRMFRNRLCNTMVATDVAARGLDINDITHVINFDFPNTVEDYIHRIGRTARAERKGTAVSLMTENNANLADKLIRVLKETDQPIPNELQELANNKDRFFSDTRDFSGQNRRNPRNDFYSGGRGGGSGGPRHAGGRQSQGYNNQASGGRSRLIMTDDEFDEDDDNFDDRRVSSRNSRFDQGDRFSGGGGGGNRGYENQDRRRSRAGFFDDN